MTHRLHSALLLVLTFCCATANADPGHPFAVRQWGNGVFTIETMWNLELLIDLRNSASDELKSRANHVVGNENIEAHVLSRLPNEPKVSWVKAEDAPEDPNRIRVQVRDGVVSVNVDGVDLLFLNADQPPKQLTDGTTANVLILSATTPKAILNDDVRKFVPDLRPRVTLIDCPEDAKEIATELAHSPENVRLSQHNTLAFSDDFDDFVPMQFAVLNNEPQPMPEELSDLFARMEASCEQSQEVFAKLSTKQMNFKPSNGTHTPRWNTEHMMGRQLLFFSQIYNKLDPRIPVMDLNPKQMPKDYVYAHEDWTGAEESQQMERVSQFTRRFAYLIHDQNVNKRAPGSRWPSLKALLLQMERHYSEHTANTVKKFELPDWPEE